MNQRDNHKSIYRLLFYALASTILYGLVFFFSHRITQITQGESMAATVLVLLLIAGVSGLYGNTTSLFLKSTLERKLDNLGRERDEH